MTGFWIYRDQGGEPSASRALTWRDLERRANALGSLIAEIEHALESSHDLGKRIHDDRERLRGER